MDVTQAALQILVDDRKKLLSLLALCEHALDSIPRFKTPNIPGPINDSYKIREEIYRVIREMGVTSQELTRLAHEYGRKGKTP